MILNLIIWLQIDHGTIIDHSTFWGVANPRLVLFNSKVVAI